MGKSELNYRRWSPGAVAGGLALACAAMLVACGGESERPYPDKWPSGIPASSPASPGAPNIIIINADDLGYGDLSCYGGQAIKTPDIDRLAEQGVRFTDFHASDSVCTPSRAGLLTGRYPARMQLDTPLSPGEMSFAKSLVIRFGYLCGKIGLMDLASTDAAHGINQKEITLAEALKAAGYRTAMIGKWHLGDYIYDAKYNPVNHGFDSYLGVPYSNDMEPFPLYRGLEVLEKEITDQGKLTRTYTEEALRVIDSAGDKPFFLYFAHTFPHRPLFASEKFKGTSEAGTFGDVVEEINWSVARVLEALDKKGLADNTIVIFTSDNGPWYQGSPGGLRGRKGQTFEGGHRVPFIARWPEHIPRGSTCDEPAMNIDLFPTLLAAAGVAPPADRIIDGVDITKLLTSPGEKTPHEEMFFYHHGDLEGVRIGKWKYFRSLSHYVWPMPVNKKLGYLANHTSGPLPLLFNLDIDRDESYNLAEKYPDMAAKLDAAMDMWQEKLHENPLGRLD